MVPVVEYASFSPRAVIMKSALAVEPLSTQFCRTLVNSKLNFELDCEPLIPVSDADDEKSRPPSDQPLEFEPRFQVTSLSTH